MKNILKNKHSFYVLCQDGGKQGNIWRISHKASQPVVTTFDYRQLLGWGLGIWYGS